MSEKILVLFLDKVNRVIDRRITTSAELSETLYEGLKSTLVKGYVVLLFNTDDNIHGTIEF